MGRYLILMVTGLMMLFSTVALKLNQNRIKASETNAQSYSIAHAKNLSTSGAYMAISHMSLNNAWKSGFSELALSGAVGRVRVDDPKTNSSLSGSELQITSVAFFENASETTIVNLNLPPEIGEYALYATGDVKKINVYDKVGIEDSTLLAANTGAMPAFDWDGLEGVAAAQELVEGGGTHIIGSGGTVNIKDYFPGKSSADTSFYFKDNVPNVTVVHGDLKVSGNTIVYGIVVVHGDVIMDGDVHVEGVIAMPDPGSVIIHGGGDPRIMNVTGGMFINGDVTGTGNHVSVQYQPDYMSIFAGWQGEAGVTLTRWLDSATFQ